MTTIVTDRAVGFPGNLTTNTYAVRTDGLSSSNSSTTTRNAVFVLTYRVSNRTSDFKKVAKQKNLPCNDFYYVRTTFYDRYGSAYYSTYDVPWTNTSSSYGYYQNTETVPIAASASLMSAVDAKAVTKVLAQIKDMKTNVAQMIAEREQTMSLIVSTAIRIAKMYTSLKRGDIPGAAKAVGQSWSRGQRRQHKGNPAKLASQYWLELQYGWKPLLQDLYGSAEQVGQRVCGELRADAKGSATLVDSSVEKTQNASDLSITTRDSSYTVKYKIFYGTPNINLHLAAQLGITNPLLLAWELLPYSFVVDWFLPIGNWINTLDATSGLLFIKGSKTTFYKHVAHRTMVHYRSPSLPPRVLIDIGQYSEGAEKLEVQRYRLVDFPAARFPSFKSPISPVHGANALALLTLAFRSR